jgi:hypothetical protein
MIRDKIKTEALIMLQIIMKINMKGKSMDISLINKKLSFFFLAFLFMSTVFARDNGFAGGLVGGLTGGIVAGAISRAGTSKDQDLQEIRNREHEREIESLKREKDQEKLDQLRRSVESKEQSRDSFILYILFFFVFILLIGVGILGFMVFKK